MKNVGIIGATGYTGITLVELLLGHPEVELAFVTSESSAGKPLAAVYPHLAPKTDLVCLPASQAPTQDVDLVFVALPHGSAMGWVKSHATNCKKIIDLSADYRLKDPKTYQSWYQHTHEDTGRLAEAVYGLPEYYRAAIQKAHLIANPGCYATAALLALLPLLTAKLIKPASIVVDAKSGVSGAGRTPSLTTHFGEANESVGAYKVAEHRHTPEIEENIHILTQTKFPLTFVPHLIPMTRGIFCTVYADIAQDTAIKANTLPACYQEAYQDEPFMHLLPTGTLPQTKYTLGSNHCFIAPRFDARTGRVVVLSVLDNLVKGAAGQAVQNMNLALGLPETTGLDQPTLYP